MLGLTTAWGGGGLPPWLQTPWTTVNIGEGDKATVAGAPEPDGGWGGGGTGIGAGVKYYCRFL